MSRDWADVVEEAIWAEATMDLGVRDAMGALVDQLRGDGFGSDDYFMQVSVSELMEMSFGHYGPTNAMVTQLAWRLKCLECRVIAMTN